MQGATSHYTSIQSLLLGHLIPNFVGYLPSLNNGTTYTSQGGSNFTVTTDGCDYYINNAKIVLSNVVLGNGVAHVIDQVIQPSTVTPTVSPSPKRSSSSSLRIGSIKGVITVCNILLFLWAGLLL